MTNETSPDAVWSWALDELAAFGQQWRQLQKHADESSLPDEHETKCCDEDAIKTDKPDIEKKRGKRAKPKLS